MLTVAELTADLELGFELVAGHSGAGREIEAAAVSELAHPGPWLQGGELLLTIGLLLPQTSDGCRSYLAELDAAGVQAVGLGLGAELPHQAAPARLITAADEFGMPLLTVPDPVPVYRGDEGGVRLPRPRRAEGTGVGAADPTRADRRRRHARAACSASWPLIATPPAAGAWSIDLLGSGAGRIRSGRRAAGRTAVRPARLGPRSGADAAAADISDGRRARAARTRRPAGCGPGC